jgi:hypothetical protein
MIFININDCDLNSFNSIHIFILTSNLYLCFILIFFLAPNTTCLVKIPSSVFIYSSSSSSVQTTYHNDIALCAGVSITYSGWGGGYSYLENNAVVYGGGGGSRTIFLKAGARYYSQGGGSHNIYYEQGAQFDGAGYTRLCSKLIFQYPSTGACS